MESEQFKIIMPMAGRGTRYADKGYETPKPLIEVGGKPMIFWALDGLLSMNFSELILVVLQEHEDRFHVSSMVSSYLEKFSSAALRTVTIPEVTEGQLCTVLAATPWIQANDSILVAASDTYIVGNLGADILNKPDNCAGIISVNNLPGEQWSFAKTDETGWVVEVAEKVRISDFASNGLYYFSEGRDLVTFGQAMVEQGERTRGEFFVIPVYQKMIDTGHKIMISHAQEMWDLGTPEAKAKFEAHISK